jgi:dihydroxyacetone kinase-like protein
MAPPVDAAAVKAALRRWADAMQASAGYLNEPDGKLGDGDLGATLEKCAVNVRTALPAMPDALDGIFKACAKACAKASGSSFGTLLAQAFFAAAKKTAGQPSITASDLAPLLDDVVAVLSARGGAKLGDKTMLDSLDSIGRVLADAPPGADCGQLARQAARDALDTYRQRPNKVGRARMFAEKSVGLDDPGMVAVERMAASIAPVAAGHA